MNRSVRILALLVFGLMILLSVSSVFAQRAGAPTINGEDGMLSWTQHPSATNPGNIVGYYVVVRQRGDANPNQPGNQNYPPHYYHADFTATTNDVGMMYYVTYLSSAQLSVADTAYAIDISAYGADGMVLDDGDARTVRTTYNTSASSDGCVDCHGPAPLSGAAVPAGLAVSEDGGKLTWVASAGAAGYQVLVKQAGVDGAHGRAFDVGNVTEFMLGPNQVSAAGDYVLRVLAYDENGSVSGSAAAVRHEYAEGSLPMPMPMTPDPGDGGNMGGGGGGGSSAPAAAATPKPAVHTCRHLPSNIIVTVSDVGPQCQVVSGGGIGNAAVLAGGVIAAVDVWSYIGHGVEVCIMGSGTMTFLDAAGQPRMPETLASYMAGPYTCSFETREGTFVLQP